MQGDGAAGSNDKGQGRAAWVEGKLGWHGKAFKMSEEADRDIKASEEQILPEPPGFTLTIPPPPAPLAVPPVSAVEAPAYKAGELVPTREAYGTAIAKLAKADPRGGGARRRRQELHVQRAVVN